MGKFYDVSFLFGLLKSFILLSKAKLFMVPLYLIFVFISTLKFWYNGNLLYNSYYNVESFNKMIREKSKYLLIQAVFILYLVYQKTSSNVLNYRKWNTFPYIEDRLPIYDENGFKLSTFSKSIALF